jgi:uroporphyrinogen-III synthase
VSTGEGFVEEFARRFGMQQLRVLFPTTAERRGALESGLRNAGFDIEAMVIYNTICPDPGEAPDWDGHADAVILTSPKAAGFFLQLAQLPPECRVISIGPATTAYLVNRRIMPVYEAVSHDVSGVREVLDVLFG